MGLQFSVLLISCDLWPLLFLLLGILMWLLGWLFGRSKVSKLRGEIDRLSRDHKILIGEKATLEKDMKIVKSDYERTNNSLITAKNSLEEKSNKLNSLLSKFRMVETEKTNLLAENNKLTNENKDLFTSKNKLLSEKTSWESERSKLKENSLDAADANVSNKAIADLQAKLGETERELAACKANRIQEESSSFIVPPPPPSNSAEINQLLSDEVKPPISTPIPVSTTGGSGKNMSNHFKNSNLQIIEGVGPKIESILKEGGFNNWDEMAGASDAELQKVLDDAGPRYRMHSPSAWSDQARYASKGQWDDLIKYQKDLDGDANEPSSKVEKLYFKAIGFAAAKSNDLKVVEGIGPKIESLLKAAGIQNWGMLASTDVNRLQDILTSAGDRYRLADPATWAKQAELANAGKWTELKEYQDFLSGGKA